MDELEQQRQYAIHEKGFDMIDSRNQSEYGKIKVGVKTLEDAILNLGVLQLPRRPYCTKEAIMRAIAERDYTTMRLISDFFYNASGIYQSICNYAAFLYRYDWYIYPENVSEKAKPEKVVEEYVKLLSYLDGSYIKKMCGDIALKVIKYGVFYGYIVDSSRGVQVQELPPEYCRTRYSLNGMPVIEFNMAFFDNNFKDVGYRMKVLKLFPDEFARGYVLYKQGKLPGDCWGDGYGWYMLEPGLTVKFNLNGSDQPMFINAIPHILDLDAAQELDRKKQMQKLLKILVQKLPMDKNGDLIFDVDEARDIHNTAVKMLSRAVGVDVITTFADVDSIDISDKNTTTAQDDLAKVERSVYQALGISRNIFNAEGNTALATSILDDESSLRNLELQFEIFFDKIIAKKSANKKFSFRFIMMETTQYNYKELSDKYKALTQNGQSKFLPMVALGHSQSSVLNLAYFENNILELPMIMIPPLMSSTMNGEDILGIKGQGNTSNSQSNTEGGRPEKSDTEKSDKTIANRNAQS